MTQPPPNNLAGMSMAELLDTYANSIWIATSKPAPDTKRMKAIRAEIDERIECVQQTLAVYKALQFSAATNALERLKGTTP